MQTIQDNYGGIMLDVSEINPSEVSFCIVHQASLSTTELLTPEGIVFQRSICPLGQRNVCSFSGSVKMLNFEK